MVIEIQPTISAWLDGLRSGNDQSARELWERYFQRLTALVDRRLPRGQRRDFDEEDIALSAFHSLCRGVNRGRFPDVDDHNDLWSLLVVIAARKIMKRQRSKSALKRGGNRVGGESVFDGHEGGGSGLAQVIGREPSPEFAAEVAEESESLLSFLEDPSLKKLVCLKMEGQTNQTIAREMGCAIRTVERRLEMTRRLWIQFATEREER